MKGRLFSLVPSMKEGFSMRKQAQRLTEEDVRRLAELEARRVLEEDAKQKDLAKWALTKRVVAWLLMSAGGVVAFVAGRVVLKVMGLS